MNEIPEFVYIPDTLKIPDKIIINADIPECIILNSPLTCTVTAHDPIPDIIPCPITKLPKYRSITDEFESSQK